MAFSLESISAFSPILPLVVGIKKKPGLVWGYILLGLISNLLISEYFNGTRIMFVVANIYILIEFYIISSYFFMKFSPIQKRIVYLGFAAWALSAYNILWGDLYQFNFFCAAILSFFYIAYCLLALYVIMLDTRIRNVSGSPFFFITIGFLIYFSGMFMLFSSGSYLKNHEILWGFHKGALMGGLWMINSLSNIVQSLIFTIAFLVEKKVSLADKNIICPE